MKKILSTTAIAGSLCLLGTSVFAQFSGPYAGVSVSAAGFSTQASKTNSNTGSTGSGEGPVGATFPLAALDIGYSFPAGKGVSVALGATYTPLKADFDGRTNDTNTETGGSGTRTNTTNKFEVKNSYSIYLAPSFEINKDAAVIAKVHYTEADVSATNVTTQPGDLKGYGGSLGLRVMLTKDAFMQVEAAYTKYDTVTATQVSTGSSNTPASPPTAATSTRTFTAKDPAIAEGRITIGTKF